MRPLWSGVISFGLINIPVRLYGATREKTLDLDYLRKRDLCPIRYARVCKTTGEEVPYRDIVRGYQYRKGDYVVLQDEDFRRASVRKTQTIDVVDFISPREIDTRLYEKPFYLEPTRESRKIYALLREALRRSQKVGVGRFVLRTREHLGVLRAEKNVIILNQVRFEEEIRPPEGLDLPGNEGITEREMEMALKLIGSLSEPFRPEAFKDTYAEELQELIRSKVKGKLPRVKREEIVPTKVPDLLDRLQESLEYAHRK